MTAERIYHIFPLGFTGANQDYNDGVEAQNLQTIEALIPHMKSLNTTLLLLGPVFESESHGYDTVDYGKVDRRLGTKEDLKNLVSACHSEGIKVMLDCVFNHIARGHEIFRDVKAQREGSAYREWVHGLNFVHDNGPRDGFSYSNWDGHDHLVKLNLENHNLRQWLVNTALSWIDDYDIDGLRMDAADVMSKDFLRQLSGSLRNRKPAFMMLAEVVHGDYNQWLREGSMDCVTNYESHKGLWSSLNDGNYYEVGYALNRQFGPGGVYAQTGMVNFADNHDVTRVASVLKDPRHLYPLHIMLYTMPGSPAVYYGSEMGVQGQKGQGTDRPLRPEWSEVEGQSNQDLLEVVRQLSTIHKDSIAIREGGYQQVFIDHQTIGYKRQWDGQDVYVFINAKDSEVTVPTPMVHGDFWDLLNQETVKAEGNVSLHGNWGRIMVRQKV